MVTKLDKPLRREITIRGKPFVVTLTPDGIKLIGKGRRKGLEISWDGLTSGEAALATALSASLDPTLKLEPSKARTPARALGKHPRRLQVVKGARHRRPSSRVARART
jgi:hypothetical protein